MSAEYRNRPRIVIVMKVRDEADVIAHNLRFHHGLGVDHFVITDHKSRDGTPELLRAYAEAGLATVRRSESDDYYGEAAAWQQQMARLAAGELGADWVIYADADEFWLPAYGNLREVLAAIPPQYGAVIAPRTEFVGRVAGPPDFASRLTVRETRSQLRPKIAHRADPKVIALDKGGHNVASEDDDPVPQHGSERAVLRGGRRDIEGGSGEMKLVWAPRWPIRVLHFPIRSPQQIKRRTEIYLYEAGVPGGRAYERLRERFEAGEIEAIYRELALGEEEIAAGIGAGELVVDTRLRDLLACCPDPLAADAPPPGSVRLGDDPQARERELAELELDAMNAITRFHYRLTVNKTRIERRARRLQRQLRRLSQASGQGEAASERG